MRLVSGRHFGLLCRCKNTGPDGATTLDLRWQEHDHQEHQGQTFCLDSLDDHVRTCTVHSGAKKAHDWSVDQLADLFRTTRCGDIELVAYLSKAEVPVLLVLDLWIAHECFGSTSDPVTLVLMDTYTTQMT
jgi:hypothetical protein